MNKYIKTNKNFKNSINLQYDINNYRKMNDYIITDYGINMIEQLIDNVLGITKNNANILVGPYGKGKSHMMLLLLGLLRQKGFSNLEEIANKLLTNESISSEKLSKIEDKSYLPIILTSGYESFSRTLLMAINKSLSENSLSDLKPKNFYTEAVDVLEKWNQNKKASDKLADYLNAKGLSINEIRKKLLDFDEEAFRIFKELYSEMTFGTEFNPIINTNIVKTIEYLNRELNDKTTFDGIYIVFDEFSKFLEGSVEKNVSSELNIIQELAELANTSDGEIIFTCITHKTINEYVYLLPKAQINSWKAIEGRFKEYYFTSSSKSNYELISNTIIKQDEYKNKFKESLKLSQSIYDYTSERKMFDGTAKMKELLAHECFPLNPITSFALIRVSEKVAQNERTLFTFLSNDGHNTLNDFLKKNEKGLLGLDIIYDYFKKTFEQEGNMKRIYNIWLKASTSLESVEREIDKRIIKALAIINIVNEYRFISPIEKEIRLSLSLDGTQEKLIKQRIKFLEDEMILMKKNSNEHLLFLPGSNINIKEKINKKLEIENIKYNFTEKLEEIINPGYVVPKRYNYECKMTRFYKKIFLLYSQVEKIDFYQLWNDSKSDGVIINIINDKKEEINKIIDSVSNIRKKYDNRIIFVVVEDEFKIKRKVEEYNAIIELKKDKNLVNQSKYIINELDIYLQDLEEEILDKYSKTFLDYEKITLVSDTKMHLKNNKELNRYISDVCFELYSKTPEINNEMINKNNISSQIRRARDTIIEVILEDKDNLGVKENGNSAEATLYRSLIGNKGLENDDASQVILKSDDPNLNKILELIEDFILSSEGKMKSFTDLYNKLKEPPFNIRNGIIPVYLALVLKGYADEIVIYYNNSELDLDLNIINKINKDYGSYSLLVEKGTKKKVEYLNKIEEIFKNESYINKSQYNRYHHLVSMMQEFIRRLPKYTKEFEVYYVDGQEKILEDEFIQLRRYLLSFDINSHELLFKIIPEKIFRDNDLNEIVGKLEKFRTTLKNHIYNQKKYLGERIIDIINPSFKGNIYTLLQDWYISIEESDRKQLMSANLMDIFETIRMAEKLNNYDENFIIGRIARIITQHNIEDWSDSLIQKFLSDFKEEIQNFKEIKDKSLENIDHIDIIFSNEEESKTIIAKEIEGHAIFLRDEISELIDEYADSINEDDLQNVLIKLIKEKC